MSPNVSDMSSYVVAGDDVKDGDMIVFVDGGKMHKYEDGRQTIQFNVTCPNGKTKLLSLNRTSANNLSEVYGSATEEWQGRNAMVTIVKMNVRGQLKNVIYLFPVK
jgi:hypothetical protein